MKTNVSRSIVFALILLSIPALAYGQRGGRGGGGGAVRGGSSVGGIRGPGVVHGPVIGNGVDRRTAVIAAGAANGTIGDGEIGDRRRDRIDNRPGVGGGVKHPGLAAAAIARRVPIGTVIETLPYDCAMTYISEMEYYYCSGQYYLPMGAEGSQIYVATEPYIPEY